MKIDIYPSASGDCLLVTSSDGKRLLTDAGLPEAYDSYIAKELGALRKAGETIDVAYISHIDRDHIGGVLKLLDDEVSWRAYDRSKAKGGRLREPKVPRPPRIGQIWHNAFLEEIEATEKVKLGPVLAASAESLSALNLSGLDRAQQAMLEASVAGAVKAAKPSGPKEELALTKAELAKKAVKASEVAMLALSVGDAIEVNWRIGGDQLDIPLNPDFAGALMTARPNQPIALGSLNITVLGPNAKELKELRADWIKWLRANQSQLTRLRKQHDADRGRLDSATPRELANAALELALSVEKDVTPPNLASLVLLVDEGGKRLLLTGDAGDETLLAYLEAANLLDANGRIEVDVLKVPHHGAHNSFSKGFVERVRAEHYIFCGDGEHHNPEPTVVAGYVEAARTHPLSDGRPSTCWFNWSSARGGEHLDLWREVEGLFKPGVPGIKRRSLRKTEKVMRLDL